MAQIAKSIANGIAKPIAKSISGTLLNYNLLKADTTMFKADRTLSLTIENEHTNVREQFILLNERFTELYLAFNQFI